MILEALSQLLSGNLFWFVEIVLNNLHWVFALFAFVVIANKELGIGNYYRGFIFLVGLLWAFSSIADLTGLVIFSAGIFLIFQFLIIIFYPPSLAKKHPGLQLSVIVTAFLLASMLLTFGLI